ncbi:SRPBCC domain-containing protein [Muriicola sp.]|uniref:SRPBCC family protein n=1 Tax=Muriicola sp. TaxID=2020856 RepID=UPI003567128D
MSSLGFESFTKKIYIKAPLEKLYWCWATPEGICSWFLQEAVYENREGRERKPKEFVGKGDRYTWRWYNWDGQETGEILQANGKDRIEFSFAEFCRVTVELAKDGDQVLISLTQANIPTDEESKIKLHVGCSNGWTFWLANLKAYLEYGILLHETEKNLRKIPMASFEFVNI